MPTLRIAALIPMATLLAILAYAGFRADGAAQEPLTLAIDVDPTGNSPTSVGSIEDCRSVEPGATFDVDVVIMNVENLLTWEAPFVYDRSILEVTDGDVRMFQQANPGSDVVDFSELLPDTDGQFFMGGGDVGNALDSGTGVLVRLTLRAVGSGVGQVALAQLDFNGDAVPDEGPKFAAVFFKAVTYLGDVNGDRLFDGPNFQATIAVGEACPQGAPTATPSPIPASLPQDSDIDGFSDRIETYIGTNPLVGCGIAAWPPDANDDRDVDIGDIVALFNGVVANPPGYTPRSDLDADGDVDVGDVLSGFNGRMLTRCS